MENDRPTYQKGCKRDPKVDDVSCNDVSFTMQTVNDVSCTLQTVPRKNPIGKRMVEKRKLFLHVSDPNSFLKF